MATFFNILLCLTACSCCYLYGMESARKTNRKENEARAASVLKTYENTIE